MTLNKKNLLLLSVSFFVSSCSSGKQHVPVGSKEEKEFNFGSLADNNFLPLPKSEDLSLKEKKKKWDKCLQVLASFPIVTSDFTGGVISTDWFEKDNLSDQRYRISIYIIQKTDGFTIDVIAFRESFKNGHWGNMQKEVVFENNIRNKILA